MTSLDRFMTWAGGNTRKEGKALHDYRRNWAAKKTAKSDALHHGDAVTGDLGPGFEMEGGEGGMRRHVRSSTLKPEPCTLIPKP